MTSALLGKYYPLSLLSPAGLDALESGVSVQTYEDGDYIYSLWDDSSDLLYILDGQVQVMESGSHDQRVLTPEDPAALKPFSHEIANLEAAVAKHNAKILKVDFELFSSILARDSDQKIELKIRKHAADNARPEQAQSEDIQPLEVPNFDEDEIELKPVNTTPPSFSRRSAVNRESHREESVEAAVERPVFTARAVPPEQRGEPPEAAPVAKPAKFTRNVPRPAMPAQTEPKKVIPPAAAQQSASKVEKPPVMAAAKPAASTVKTTAKPAVQSRKQRPAKPPAPSYVNPSVEHTATTGKKVVEKFINRLKDELTEERRFDLKLVKSVEKPETEKAPAKIKVEQGLVQKLKQELTAERRFDLKLVKSAAKPEPAPAPVKQASEIDRYLEAMALYREQKWAEAHAAFLALNIDHPSTNIYMIYASKCSELIADETLRTG